jgi:hypothetical protein
MRIVRYCQEHRIDAYRNKHCMSCGREVTSKDSRHCYESDATWHLLCLDCHPEYGLLVLTGIEEGKIG